MKKEIFENYAVEIATSFGLTKKELFSRNRSRHIVDARWVLYYLCIERPISRLFIQQYMEDSGLKVSYNNIIHGYKEGKKLINEDYDYKVIVDNILNKYE